MGFNSSVARTAKRTRFKRKMTSGAAFTPPAAPFNNTTFLIQLQQLRELQYCSSPKNFRFDQYGSMENMICSSFTTPASPKYHSTSHSTSNLSTVHMKESSQNTDQTSSDSCDPSDHDGIFQEFPGEFRSCSDDIASSVTEPKIETDPEMREGDDTQTNHHSQHFMDDDTDRSSGTSLQK